MAIYKKIKKGNKVKMLAGKDKGKDGKVLKVFPIDGRVVVEGLNLRLKNVRPKKAGEKGQQIRVPAPVAIAKVGLICSHCHQVTRVGFQTIEKGAKGETKIRICKKCKEALE
ncbi:50S ribosomal protein L24 [Candidatus Falkowbacteria bacterium]|nr:50S ribosomal protein L24 [Candidatus Falkowbacteria bacterium]